MSSALRGNAGDDSKGSTPGRSARPAVSALRSGLALAGLAGAFLLLLATFATVIQITVGTSTAAAGADTSRTGWDRHGPALILLALFAGWLLALALRGARAAMAGLAAAGVAALAIAMLGPPTRPRHRFGGGRLRRGPRRPGRGLLPRDAGRSAPASRRRHLARPRPAGTRPGTRTAASRGGRRRVVALRAVYQR